MKNARSLVRLCFAAALVGLTISMRLGSCMSVTDGLALWLKADSITDVAPGGGVSVWPDSSGSGLDVAQPDPMLQPKWQPDAV